MSLKAQHHTRIACVRHHQIGAAADHDVPQSAAANQPQCLDEIRFVFRLGVNIRRASNSEARMPAQRNLL